jgi:hypothetical protein
MIKDSNLDNKPQTTTYFDPDDVMPHMGTLFGLTEDATSIILVEMGCLSEHQKGRTTIICLQGWYSLASEFNVKNASKLALLGSMASLCGMFTLETFLRAFNFLLRSLKNTRSMALLYLEGIASSRLELHSKVPRIAKPFAVSVGPDERLS